jgi:threonine aldolase
MPEPKYQFASDNSSGICPEAWEAMARANQGCAAGYGDDIWTRRAIELIQELFETDCEVFFTFNGTAANSLALAHLCRSYHSVICHESSHVATDECGAPEFFTGGVKLLPVPGEAGRLAPKSVERATAQRRDVHFPKAKGLSVTQATELGTVYTVQQIEQLGETARRLNLKLHMDGSRFANAVASLGCSPKELTWKAGVEVLSFGGAKNGLPLAETVVFFDKNQAAEFEYRRKQAGQLGSKMRFLAAPWVGLLESGAWLRNAQHANRCAKLLEAELRKVPGIRLLTTVEANSVFVELSPSVAEAVRAKGWRFYTFIGESGMRFMCSWNTSEEDIHALAADIRAALTSAFPASGTAR